MVPSRGEPSWRRLRFAAAARSVLGSGMSCEGAKTRKEEKENLMHGLVCCFSLAIIAAARIEKEARLCWHFSAERDILDQPE